jgi:hypothetical protein
MKNRIHTLLFVLLWGLLGGNAINNFFRYTDLYKFFRPHWLQQMIFIHDHDLFPDPWGIDVKRPSPTP